MKSIMQKFTFLIIVIIISLTIFSISAFAASTSQNIHENEVAEEIYDFYIDKKQLNIDIGSSEKLEITAKLKDGYVTIAQYEEATDNWDVTWEIEDGSIAKCTPEKGIVNNIYGLNQTVGRAEIQGVKVGNTKLLIQVKISDNQFKEFSVPITVKEIKKDDTTTYKNLPNTGENTLIIKSIIAVISIGLIYFGIKASKQKG